MKQVIVGGLVAGLVSGVIIAATLVVVLPRVGTAAGALGTGSDPVSVRVVNLNSALASDSGIVGEGLPVTLVGATNQLDPLPVTIDQPTLEGRVTTPLQVTVSNETGAGGFGAGPVPLVVTVSGPIYTWSCDKSNNGLRC